MDNQAKEDALRAEKEKFVSGCKTVENRTVINTKESDEEARIKQSEKIKKMGNTSFRAGNFAQAEEYYTSAILQFEKVTQNIFTLIPCITSRTISCLPIELKQD